VGFWLPAPLFNQVIRKKFSNWRNRWGAKALTQNQKWGYLIIGQINNLHSHLTQNLVQITVKKTAILCGQDFCRIKIIR